MRLAPGVLWGEGRSRRFGAASGGSGTLPAITVDGVVRIVMM